MTFLELQDFLFRHLSEKDDIFFSENNIPDYELKRVIAIVKYIDNNMNSSNECINIAGLINNMRRIIKDINECSTSIPEIDKIAYERMKAYFEQYGNVPEEKKYIFYKDPTYVESLIGIMSQYGGLYKYVISHANNSLVDNNWEPLFREHYAKIYNI